MIGSPRRTKEVASFCALAAVLLAFLFRDAWLHGYVLGQADILFDLLPWRPYRPLGLRVHNRLLGDIPVVFYPFLFHAGERLSNGEFPLWAGAIGAGHPFFAAFQTALLSPFTLFDYLLPFPGSFTWDVAARLFTGGLGMYLYLRRLPVGHAAAIFGGIAFLLNPFSIVWLEHPLSAVAAWLPWLLLAVDVCIARADMRSVAMLSMATTLTVLSGHPETAFKVLLFVSAYAVYRAIVSQKVVKGVTLVAAAMLLGALVASVQIVPFLEYMFESRVLAVRREAGSLLFQSPLASFVATLVPDFYGTPLRGRFVLEGTNYNEQQLYPGMVTWVFAALGLAHRQHRGRVIFFFAAGVCAVLMMYPTPFARLVTFFVPPLRVAALSRFGLLGITAVIVAGAVGFDALFRDERGPARTYFRIAIVAGIVICVTAGLFLWAQRDLLTEGRQWRFTLLSTGKAAQLLASAVGVVFIASRVRHPWVVVLPVALLIVDLTAFANGFHALIPREQTFPKVPELEIPQADESLFRVAGWRDTLMPNTALVYRLRDFRTYDGVGLRDYEDFLDIGFFGSGITHKLVNLSTPHLVDFLNIKYVLTPSDVTLPDDRFRLLKDAETRLYLNLRVLPRAYLVDEYTVLQGNEARRAIRDRVDLSRTAVLDEPLEPGSAPDNGSGDVGVAEVRHYGDHAVTIATRASGRRLLVLSDVFYPGWVATLDGVDVPIRRANYAFRAVSVPAGEHVVEFSYRPRSVRYGAYASLASLVVVVGLLLRRGGQ